MRKLKFPFLLIAIAIALSFMAKAGEIGVAVDYYLLQDQANECKNTLNGLDKLLTAAKAVQAESYQNYLAHKNDPAAKKDYDDATTIYNGLIKWHDSVVDRFNDVQDRISFLGMAGYDPGPKKDSQNASRDSAKDAGNNAREASAEASRETTSDTVRGSMDHCAPKGGCH